MLVVPAATRTQEALDRTRYPATCWKITTAKSGTVFRFTDWAHEISLMESRLPTALQTYTPIDGLDTSARRRVDELEGQNKELRGIVSSDAIKAEELNHGLFDDARVDEFLVDGRAPHIGYIEHVRYWIREVTFDGMIYRAQVTGLTGWLAPSAGELWGPMCRVELFSSQCGVSAASYEYSGTVTAVTAAKPRLVFQFDAATGPAEAANWADDGTLIWLTGGNAGFTSEIRTHGGDGADTTLHESTFADIEVGDTGTIRAGCNKLSGSNDANGHCKNKFSNLVNFQGEPYIPGTDKAFAGLPTVF